MFVRLIEYFTVVCVLVLPVSSFFNLKPEVTTCIENVRETFIVIMGWYSNYVQSVSVFPRKYDLIYCKDI